MALTLVITNAGRAALRNADASGTRAVRIAAVGFSAAALAATATTAALPGEIKRVTTVSGDAVAADIIHLVVQDETMAVYTVRSFGLYLDDGTLFAAYGQADPIIEKSAQAVLLLALDVTLADIAAAQITFGNANFLLPPATTERAGLVELATEAEALALTDAVRALTPRNMAAIFTAANILSRLIQVDGAGSGLDADLLDGQHGSWYADIIARLGYTPVNAVSYNGYEILAKLMGNDGAGSGLDADLLDGRHAADFALLAGAAFTGAVAIAGNVAWHAGNDGAGSGLDADLLDGQHGSWYADIIARLGFTPVNAAIYNAYEIIARMLTVDGSGSGLDADLLDGREGSWYADIVARLGFTPLAASAYTAADVRSKLIGVDGAGSGIDADLLDGRHAGDFALLSGAAFTGRATTGRGLRVTGLADTPGDTGPGVEVSFDGGSGYVVSTDRSTSQPQPLVLACSVLRRNGATIMDTANDGAGSGFDADLLDGQDGEWYRRWANLTGVPGAFPPTGHAHGAADLAGAFAGSLAENGYTVLPNGLILQWTTGPMQAARTSAATYMQWPIAFPTACFQAFVSTQVQQTGDRADNWFQLVGAPDQNGATIQRQASGTADDIVASAPRVFAIGM